jgi:hypothetical protein
MDVSYLLPQFEDLVSSNKISSSNTKIILSVFIDLSTAYKAFYKELNSACMNLTDIIRENERNEMRSWLVGMYTHTEQICNGVRNLCVGMRNDVINPIERLLIEFENINESIMKGKLNLEQQCRYSNSSVDSRRSFYKNFTEMMFHSKRERESKDRRSCNGKNIYKDRFRLCKEWNCKISPNLFSCITKFQEFETKRCSILETSVVSFKYHYANILKSLTFPLPDFKLSPSKTSAEHLLNTLSSFNNQISNLFPPLRDSLPVNFTVHETPEIENYKQMSHICNLIFLENCEDRGDMQDINRLEHVFRILDTPKGRTLFCLMIENRDQHIQLPIWNLEILGSFINHLLNSLISQNDENPEIFYKLVTLCPRFYSISEADSKTYLISVISPHSIWKNPTRWQNAFKWIASLKFHTDTNTMPRHRRSRTGFSSLTETLTTLKNSEHVDKVNDSVVKDVTSEFYKSMINFGLPSYVASEILRNTCTELNLLSEDLRYYLDKVPLRYSCGVFKRDRMGRKWGSLVPMRYVLEFISVAELPNLLCVNKTWRSSLYPYILHIRIRKISHRSSHSNRYKLWHSSLKISSYSDLKYFERLHSLEQQNIEEGKYFKVIEMDLSRTYQNHPIIKLQPLSNILNVYSIYSPEIGYCQGMNFIVGTLYLVFQDEEATFTALVSLVERFNLKHMFMLNDSMLKLLFYQLDRLISIILPDLGQALKALEVKSFNFASGWFITLFSMTLKKHEELLLKLWDILLIDGFKSIFKIAVTILRRVSKRLIVKDFDEIMTMLSDISLSQNLAIFSEDFVEEVYNMKLSNSLLKYIEDEYILQPEKYGYI